MKKGLNVLIIFGLILFVMFALFPSKIDYTDQAKVLQGISLAAAYKEAVSDYWKSNGVLPDNEEWSKSGNKINLDFGKSLVESIHIGHDGPGIISIYYTNARDQSAPADIAGKKIVLTPEIKNKKLDWSCKGTIPAQYLPAPCR